MADPNSADVDEKVLNKQKLKEQRRLQWKEKRIYQRQQRKLRRKQRRAANDPSYVPRKRKPKLEIPDEYWKTAPSIAIDLSFDSDMTDREVTSLVQQLMNVYGLNTRTEKPFNLHFTSFNGRTQDKCQQLSGFEHWRYINYHDKSYMETFPKESLVYLSSESPTVLESLDPAKVYIIGGLVDHNRLKGITYKQALDQGISTAQLPIGNYLKMSTRKVLAVNHVYDILLHYYSHQNWMDAFLHAIPQRKGAAPLPEAGKANVPTGTPQEVEVETQASPLTQKAESQQAEQNVC